MDVHIQSRSINHVNIYINLYDNASLSAKNKANRCAEINKSKPSIYLGGHISINNGAINFEQVRKYDFKEKGVDFKIFETLIKNNLHFLINNNSQLKINL